MTVKPDEAESQVWLLIQGPDWDASSVCGASLRSNT